MRYSSRPSGPPAPMPSLAEVQRDPTILTGLPVPVIVDLRRQVSHLAADLDAAFCQAVGHRPGCRIIPRNLIPTGSSRRIPPLRVSFSRSGGCWITPMRSRESDVCPAKSFGSASDGSRGS